MLLLLSLSALPAGQLLYLTLPAVRVKSADPDSVSRIAIVIALLWEFPILDQKVCHSQGVVMGVFPLEGAGPSGPPLSPFGANKEYITRIPGM